jgi:hypothetical protein
MDYINCLKISLLEEEVLFYMNLYIFNPHNPLSGQLLWEWRLCYNYIEEDYQECRNKMRELIIRED